MRVVLLGTGGYHPNNRRQTACMMLPEQGILLDAGTGMFRARDHLATEQLDIYLTHAHLDHVIGLTYLFDVLWDKQVRRVNVYGSSATLAAVQQHLFAPALFPVQPPLALHPLTEKMPLAGGGNLTPFPLQHPGGAHGFRLDWPDASLAYVTDTTAAADASYVEQVRGVDVLIHECYFSDEMPEQATLTGHSCTTPVAQVAAAAGVGRLVLVHVNPLDEREDPVGLATAQRIFPDVQLGHDGMELEL